MFAAQRHANHRRCTRASRPAGFTVRACVQFRSCSPRSRRRLSHVSGHRRGGWRAPGSDVHVIEPETQPWRRPLAIGEVPWRRAESTGTSRKAPLRAAVAAALLTAESNALRRASSRSRPVVEDSTKRPSREFVRQLDAQLPAGVLASNTSSIPIAVSPPVTPVRASPRPCTSSGRRRSCCRRRSSPRSTPHPQRSIVQLLRRALGKRRSRQGALGLHRHKLLVPSLVPRCG